VEQRLKLRKLYQEAGVIAKNGEEGPKASEYLRRMRDIAEGVGGDPPLPLRPDLSLLEEIEGLVGNQQLLRMCAEDKALRAMRAAWSKTTIARQQREPMWRLLSGLEKHLGEVAGGDAVGHEMQALRDGRKLLADPDPVRPLVEQATDLLRTQLNQQSARYEKEFSELHAALQKEEVWKKLKPSEQKTILVSCGIVVPSSIDVSGAEQVLARLEEESLRERGDRIKTLPSRFDMARAETARQVEPKAVQVHLPKRLVRNEGEADAWLKDAEKLIKEQLKKGPVSI
jgi:hypothetical protein